MKKLFYVLSVFLFCVFVLASCQTSNLSLVKKNLSEESIHIYSGKTELYYVTLTTGKREEPYQVDGVSRKKVEFAVVNITFFKAQSKATVEFEISINGNISNHLAEKNPITNTYMFDLEMHLAETHQILLTTSKQQAELTCKSSTFNVDHNKAIEIGTELLKDKIDFVLEKKGSFEVFLKLATAPNNYDDKFVWYFYLQSNIAISSVVVIDSMNPSIYSIL